MSSLQLTTPLILSGDPTQPRHASTKQYVDSVLGHPNAMGFTSGTIPVSMLPALTGVVTSSAGSNVLTLNNSGVTPGTYTKVSVSSSGRISAGTSASEDDIQSVDWSRITSGKPTTLAGYGITDVLPTSGGTITGSLKLTQTPSDNLHLVTKAYVDSALLTGATVLATGDIIRKPTSVTPTGFLRLNGGLVSKTTYADLYAKVGDVFNASGSIGNGRPWEQLNYAGGTMPESIYEWSNGTSPQVGVEYSASLVTKNRVYLVGGYNTSGVYWNGVQTAEIDANGVIGSWSLASSSYIPEGTSNHTLFVTKNRVYIAGGSTDPSGAWSNKTHFAPINSDGTLGTWSTGPALPGTMRDHVSFVTKNRVYLIGAYYNDTSQSFTVVITATIDSDGVVGSWSRATDLSIPFYSAKIFVTKSRVYFVRDSNVYSVHINLDGTIGTIVTEPSLPEHMNDTSVLMTKNRVYLLGKANGSACFTTTVDENGVIGEWVNTNPSGSFTLFWRSTLVATNSRVYLLCGRTTVIVGQSLWAPLSAGFNDYSPYYGTLDMGDFFSIPDYSERENHRLCYYIKT